MNTENLNQIIDNYIEKSNAINDSENREFYKWEAVKYFQDHWDIDAPDFAGMFKEAIKKTSNILNNRTVQPANGIIKLAERPELTETIREMFRELCSDDGGDIDKRQDKIYDFLSKADELLNKYEPGKWKYSQDMRTVISYLSFINPDDNYFYKATQARKFMHCVEYGDDFGSGENFSLKKYYKMCDALVEAIKYNEELHKTHEKIASDKTYDDKEDHVFAYDIIYCALTYGLYRNIKFVRPTKNYKEQEKIRIMNELEEEIEIKNNILDEKLLELSEYDTFSAKGLIVKHKKFGEGRVIVHNGRLITVKFKDSFMKFELPDAFSKGFIATESEEIMDCFTQMAKIESDVKAVKIEIALLKNKYVRV